MFDEEEEDSAVNATRYICMPSLVSLQQMRNRLQMAHLGRKLMKWTALATGREMRKIGEQLISSNESFADDMRNAFILLARARYFYPNLNKMVLENLGTCASIKVSFYTKSMCGVRVIHYGILESGIEPYQHLGIEKGGQKIHEAKVAWLELLKKLILILELRTDFYLLDTANKSATKRERILSKVVMPRTKTTINFIKLELEELSREETYRIKMTTKRKNRAKEKNKIRKPEIEETELCPVCKKVVSFGSKSQSTAHKHEVPQIKKPPPAVPAAPAAPATPASSIAPAALIAPAPQASLKASIPETVTKATKIFTSPKDSMKEIVTPRTVQEPDEFMEPTVSKLSKKSSVEKTTSGQGQLEYIKKMLTEIITVGKNMVQTAVNEIDIEEFLKNCDEAKNKIDKLCQSEIETSDDVDPNLKDRLLHLILHLREVIELTNQFRNETFISPSVEEFIETCENVDGKLNLALKNVDSKQITDNTKEQLEKLKKHIREVAGLTEKYKNEGLLTPSVEQFIKTCKTTQAKLNAYTRTSDSKMNITEEKLQHLEDHVDELQHLAIGVKREGLKSSSLEHFLLSCKEFKSKLDVCKQKSRISPPPKIDELINQINVTIESSKTAKDKGLVSESVQDFIQYCEDMKKLIEYKNESEVATPLNELKSNIDGVINLLKDLRKEGLITESVDDFLLSCAMAKDKFGVYEKYPPGTYRTITSSIPCGKSCNCDDKDTEEEEEQWCENCEKMLAESDESLPFAEEPCDECKGGQLLKKNEEKVEEFPCEKCGTNLQSDTKPRLCKFCKMDINVGFHSEQDHDTATTSDDDKLGYFEKNIKKIVRVTRTLNDDGTIREETQTLIIRKDKHDPNETKFKDDDNLENTASFEDLQDEDLQDEDLPDNDGTCVAVCNVVNQIGFKKAKSDNTFVYHNTVANSMRCKSMDLIFLQTQKTPEYFFVKNFLTPKNVLHVKSSNTSPSTSYCKKI